MGNIYLYNIMALVYDEYGRPFILLREQEGKKRLRGLEAHKANINACIHVANILKTSLGPRGMDKILVSPDQDITITNDGATIMEKNGFGTSSCKVFSWIK